MHTWIISLLLMRKKDERAVGEQNARSYDNLSTTPENTKCLLIFSPGVEMHITYD